VKPLRTTLFAAAGVSAAFALAACGAGTTASTPSSAPAASAPAAPSSAAGSNTAAALSVTQSPLGPIVTDAKGRTLYRFDSDTTSPPASNCTGTCASLWPPALGSASSVTVNGVNKSLVGTVTRSDGTMQLTLAGSPLYEYAGDSGPGQTAGQGVMGTWWAITPTGAKAVSAGAQSPSTSSGGGSYGY
jgi:predicted lipoprotein with Yx(FWY)xxD motif